MNQTIIINTINLNIFNINKTLSINFIIVLLLGILLITCLGAFLNHKKYKWYHPRFLVYFSTLLAIVVGLVFASFNDFKPLSANNEDNWMRQSVLFVAAIGNFYMMMLFAIIIVVAPINIIYNLKRWLMQDHPIKSFWKLNFYFIIFGGLALCASQLLWVLPGFAYDTTAQFSTVGANNMSWFYYISRWLFDNAIYTEWFAWGFILYLLLCFIISGLVVFFTRHSHRFTIDYWKTTKDKIERPTFFVHFLSFMAFIFVLQNLLMNPLGIVFHFLDIIILLFVANTFVLFAISILGAFKSKRGYIYYVKLMWYVYTKTIASTDLKKSIIKIEAVDVHKQRLGMCHFQKINDNNINFYAVASNYIFPIVFTTYLGFVNNYHTGGFVIVNHWQFWITMIIGTYFSSWIFSNARNNPTILNNASGLSAYSITAGVQTGIFNVYTKVLAHMRNVIALQFVVFETMDFKISPHAQWVD